MELILTLFALALSLSVTIAMIVLEKRPPPDGHPRLIPTTLVLFIAILAMVIVLAHLVTLFTGTPHVGRFG